jgi:hypothetical protein
MKPDEAVREVLASSGEALHWTVIQDRALRGGLIDPFETPDVKKAVLAALRTMVADGRAVRAATGVYALAD